MSIDECLKKHGNPVDTGEEVTAKVKVPLDGIVNKQITKKVMEIMEVSQLNTSMTPISRQSNVANRILLKRRFEYEKLIKKLADDFNELNQKVEENVRISSEEVKAHMQADKTRLNDILTDLDVPEVASYHDSVFHDILRDADTMKSRQLGLVNELYDDLCKFENLRASENKKIFCSSFHAIEKTYYKLPYQVQSFIEHETLKMNQLTLNNRRCYEDLKLKLTLVIEKTFKTFTDEIFCIKEKWIRFNKREAEDKLQYNEKATPPDVPPEPYLRFELRNLELDLTLTPNGHFSLVNPIDWIANVKRIMETVGHHNEFLISVINQTLDAVQKGLGGEFDDVRKSLCFLSKLDIRQRPIQPLLFEETSEITMDMNELEAGWQSTLLDLENQINGVCSFLCNVGKLWNRHYERLCESKILVLKAVEKAEENNRLILQDLEVKLNLDLDALRQEYKKEKLETMLSAVLSTLDDMKNKLESNYITEVSVTEEFYKMMTLEADVLSSEIKEFLYSTYPIQPFLDTAYSEKISSLPDNIRDCFTRSSDIAEGMFLLRSLVCQVWTALDCLCNSTRDCIEWRAEEWVQNRVQEMARKTQIILEMHNKRYERIRSQVYEIRLQEIIDHQQYFDEHKAGVDEAEKKLKHMLERVCEADMHKVEEKRSKLTEIVEEAKREEKFGSVKCVMSEVQRDEAELLNEIRVDFEEIRGEIELKKSLIQQSNLKFMRSIRLFHENGNYEVDEAKMYVDSLDAIDKEVVTEMKNLLKESNDKESEILRKVTDTFQAANRTLSDMYDELKFCSDVKLYLELCKADLREISASVKVNFKLLEDQIELMINSTFDETAFLSEQQDNLWCLLMNTLTKNICNLLYEVEFPSCAGSSDISLTGEGAHESANKADPEKQLLKKLKKEKGKEATSTIKSGYPCKDFRKELFYKIPEKDNDMFMYSVSNKCCYYMDYIQRLACVFYENVGSRTLIHENLIKRNYEEFGNDLLRVFYNYAYKCEQLWLQIIKSFLPLLSQAKAIFKTYFARRICECADTVMAALDNVSVEFTNSFNQCGYTVLKDLHELDEKLLPLHGYPRNSELLTLLENEVVEKTARLELYWELFIKKYKGKLKCFHAEHIKQPAELNMIKQLYLKLRDELWADRFGTDMVNFLKDCIKKNGYIKKVINEKENTQRGAEGFLVTAGSMSKHGNGECISLNPEICNLDIQHLNQELNSCNSYLMEINKILDAGDQLNEKYSLSGFNLRQKLLQPKLANQSQAIPIDQLIADQTGKMLLRYREVKELIDSKMNFQKEIIYNWLDQWKYNIAEITKLYAVKYTDLDGSSDNLSELSKNKSNTGYPK